MDLDLIEVGVHCATYKIKLSSCQDKKKRKRGKNVTFTDWVVELIAWKSQLALLSPKSTLSWLNWKRWNVAETKEKLPCRRYWERLLKVMDVSIMKNWTCNPLNFVF